MTNISLVLFVLVQCGFGLNASPMPENEQSFPNYQGANDGSVKVNLANFIGKYVTPDGTYQKWIDEDAIMTLCGANADGNYQNPFNCTQFIMCAHGQPFIFECPGPGSYYPTEDICLYKASPSGQCPWRAMWYVSEVNCSTMGDRRWWSPLTIPVDAGIRCGPKIRYCFREEEIGTGECPPDFGYSKVFNGCLPVETCRAVDDRWNM